MCFGCGKESSKYWGDMDKYQKKYQKFTKNDLYRMIEWFHHHSIDGNMNKSDFLEGVGFMSRAGYIFERMFDVMDKDSDGKVFYFFYNID